MPWQRSGTVAVENGSNTVIGTNVDFAASSRSGDSFIGPDGFTYEVANVASSTVISIIPPYKGASASGASYAIMPVQGYDKMLSDAFNSLNNQFGPKLAALGTTGNYDLLPASKGGTGRTSVGNVIAADVVTSPSDTTAGRVLIVGSGGIGTKDNASYLGTALNPDNYRTGGLSYWGQFVILGVASNGFLTVFPGNDANWCAQQFINVTTGSILTRAQNSSAGWSTWTAYAKVGANSDITSLSGLTTALSVSQGGTGAKTAVDARALLGIGAAGTLAVGVATGNVQTVSSPPAMVGNSGFAEQGSHFIAYGDSTTVAPPGGAYWAGIRAQYPFQNAAMDLVAQVVSNDSMNLMFRTVAPSGAAATWRKIYHDGNTTRAADGTLKAI